MTRIFISYRRQDSPSMTGRIYDQLEGAFGSDRVFRDIDDIGAGQDFRAKIAQEIGESDVLLVIIGPKWENIADNQGRRRLDNPNDFVRLEVEEGLKNPKKIVIPVLVENTSMPNPEGLPKSLRELCYRNAISIRQDPDFHPDVQKLINQIRKITRTGAPVSRNTPLLIGAGTLAVLAIIGVVIAGLLAARGAPAPITPGVTVSPTGDIAPPVTSTFTEVPAVPVTETSTETSLPPVSGPVRIGVIQLPKTIYKDTVKRLDSLGFDAEWIDVSSEYGDLSDYDVIYLPTGWAYENGVLEGLADDYQQFVEEGGGLVVEPSGTRAPFSSTLLPYGVGFNSFAYDRGEVPPNVMSDHEIVRNLRASELPGPGEKLGLKDRHWQVIATSAKLKYPTLVVADYGDGRIVLMASGISKNAEVKYQVGDHFIERLIEWVSNLDAP